MKKSIVEKIKKIRMVIMDVDGVLNDGTVIFREGGKTPKAWNVKDRLGLKILTDMRDPEIPVVWISGRPSDELTERAGELGVKQAFSDVSDKLEKMNSLLQEYGLSSEQVLYIGDDLVDLACMEKAGVGCCPADAVSEIQDRADIISSLPGGRGAVREIIEIILKTRGLWKKTVAEYSAGRGPA